MAKISTPRLRVILTDPAFPGDDEGKDYEVQTRNIELCAFDRERGRYGWPPPDDAPFVWLTYLGWKALMRTGQIPPCSLADFEQRCMSIDRPEDEEVDPTQPAATDE